ncbi:MAG: hypothetical protein JJ899_10605 [Alphaproteobacteria bacterium]|nr:hypothetical protein [Alphaproteobacteria bacterium]
MKKLLTARNVLRDYKRTQQSVAPADGFLAIVDFGYQHYALGDLLTKEVNFACQAIEAGVEHIDLAVAIDPARPSASAQGFVTPENYQTHFLNLAPALLCTPMLRSFRLLRDGGMTASLLREAARDTGAPMWPAYEDQILRRITYPLGHDAINAFHEKHGFIPKLQPPRGYLAWAEAYRARFHEDKFLVSINPRQSRLTANPAVIYRDADLDEWYEFIGVAGKEFPDVQFLQLGGFDEWRRELSDFPNVTIPRAEGLGLAHELALLTISDLFLGTSSGFATMATFTDTPYLICDIEHFFAPFAGIDVGAEHYPFAHDKQLLLWGKESADLLLAHLESNLEKSRSSTAADANASPIPAAMSLR